MDQTQLSFQETNLWDTPIRDLGLTIGGTRLEPIVADFLRELDARGIRLRPRFYLSSEWGVPFETISIAIPFYLADTELMKLHRERVGVIEGLDRDDVLRYLRHEMGHVMNYAYRLYDSEEWVKLFGSISQPYEDDYTPQPFSRRHVRHLPGWYAQKHPDEDWSETFAVWMTPGLDWYADYRAWPVALAKLKYCDRIISRVRDTAPIVTDDALDEDVAEIAYTLEDFYDDAEDLRDELPPGIDGALRAIFRDFTLHQADAAHPLMPAATLLRRLERDLMSSIFRWTGHFPERTSLLVRHLAERATTLGLGYDASREEQARVAVTTFVTALAMNFIHRGAYLP